MSLDSIAPPVVPEHEIEIRAIRAQGAGGQNVNKVSNAVHLRFDINASSLPAPLKEKLLALRHHYIGKDGCVVIKAQRFRSLEQNREDAIARLADLVRRAGHVQKTRRATRPTAASKQRRLDSKSRQSQIKRLRREAPE